MHRTGPILLAAAALLTGCSPGSSTPATDPSPAPAAATSPAESPTPTDSGIFASQFHPCEVFTEEQFAAAGLGKRLIAAEDPASRVKSCGFAHQRTDVYEGSFLIATDTMDKWKILERELEPVDSAESEVEGIYTHQMPTEAQGCSAALDFEWGRFSVDYRELGEIADQEFLCSVSVAILESLIIQSGGKYGT
ncbi:hypothetical protein HMPREF0290_2247 [Corynebacterium efficiens YS-314]|uniref:DUF3558 domain-containing protein n=1 Tax=Corynebacterium efficiens (strain DSM 44549 / YS-314 / AJ 12310 / JCM 11189 / NBRC 100395) TaxID=196164 RepID=Q8FND5_COREF|nr:DUF3558 domain-containing protein [Corynebacterium efficiens]EEW49174.1 hypothetical protein HMPREF0290_2247 [Corynebacterium efficiens YS-314]BAC19019.1 hypothetical protein [Corynebacterium efficiens YS-314]